MFRQSTRWGLGAWVVATLILVVGCGKRSDPSEDGLCTDPFLHTYTAAKAEVDAFKLRVEKKAETNFDNLKRLDDAKKLQNKLRGLLNDSYSDNTYCRMAADNFYRHPYSYYFDLKIWVDNYIWAWK